MKFLEKFALTIFSLIILVISAALLCIMFNVIEAEIIIEPIKYILENDTAFKATLSTAVILILLAIKCLFFRSKNQNMAKEGIVLENASGKLVISKESLENLVASVAKEIPGTEAVSSKTVLDKDRNLKVYVSTSVCKDVILKDVSSEFQNRIKETMKNTADLDVKEVNIKIKNITAKKVKKAEKPEKVEKKEKVQKEDKKEETIPEEKVEKSESELAQEKGEV